jgi:hypothetical protein
MPPGGFPRAAQADVRRVDNSIGAGFPTVSKEEQLAREARRLELLKDEQAVIGSGKDKALDADIADVDTKIKTRNPFKKTGHNPRVSTGTLEPEET